MSGIVALGIVLASAVAFWVVIVLVFVYATAAGKRERRRVEWEAARQIAETRWAAAQRWPQMNGLYCDPFVTVLLEEGRVVEVLTPRTRLRKSEHAQVLDAIVEQRAAEMPQMTDAEIDADWAKRFA